MRIKLNIRTIFCFKVLNAKPENVEREAEIVAQSGRLGAVTIATNMAGRGTDIILGGNAEFMARLKLREIMMPRYGGALIGIHLHPFLLFPQAYSNRLVGFWTSIVVTQQYSTIIHVKNISFSQGHKIQ